jgi:hypothetical protein
MVKFLGEPFQLIRFNPPIGLVKYVRFDEKGEYTTENERIIKRFHHNFDSVPADGGTETPELSEDDLQLECQKQVEKRQYNCNQCDFTSENKGVLLAHKKTEHPKED